MTGVEFIARVRSRGGDLRLSGERLQYRPPGLLSPREIDWLTRHQREIADSLKDFHASVATEAVLVGLPLGEAGPKVPAWHCHIVIRAPHEMARRVDGSSYCGTCHPLTVAHRDGQ